MAGLIPNTLRGQLLLVPIVVVVVLLLALSFLLVNREQSEQEAVKEASVDAVSELTAATSGLGFRARREGDLKYAETLATLAFERVADIETFTIVLTSSEYDAPARLAADAPWIRCTRADDTIACDRAPKGSPALEAQAAAILNVASDHLERGVEVDRGVYRERQLLLIEGDQIHRASPVYFEGPFEGVDYPKHLVGMIVVSATIPGLFAAILEVGFLAVALAGGTLVLALAIFGSLNRMVVGPVTMLASAAREVARDISKKGNIEPRRVADLASADTMEINELIDSFDTMTERVRENKAQLRAMNESLEKTVEERTAELNDQVERANALVADIQTLNVELVDKADEAKAASQAKSEFLARMNHEIRNPLNSIIQRAEYLQEIAEEEELDEYHEETTGILNKSQHLLGVINQVLDMSKIEAGKIEPEVNEREIEVLVEELRDMTEPLVTANGSKFVINADHPGLNLIATDITMVRQCVVNLVSNAAKFTKKGTVTLTVAPAPRETAAERLGKRAGDIEDWISFKIEDTGIGMTEEELSRIFVPFEQANASISAKYGGTGIGVVLTQKFVHVLGGDIFVSSQKDVGTTAEIILPRRLPGAAIEAARQAEGRNGPSILIIDDETEFHTEMEAALEGLNAVVRHARTADSGLTICRTARPDAVILDVLMPVVDGWKVLRELRKDPELQDIPVLVVTKTEAEETADKLGATGFFSKPLSAERLDELLAVVERVSQAGKLERVLVVDDEAPIRRTLRRTFESRGATVHEAENGAHALELLEHLSPDLVLTDLMMPVMDGFEAISRIRENEDWRELPIIVLTSKDLTSNERNFLLGATDGLLDKNTVDLKEVVSRVARIVDRGGKAA